MKQSDQIAARTEENLRFIIEYMDRSGPVSADEIAELIGKHGTTARDMLKRCVDRGLATKQIAGKKKFAGNRWEWHRTSKPFVMTPIAGSESYDFAGLIASWGIPAQPPAGIMGRIHRLSWEDRAP